MMRSSRMIVVLSLVMWTAQAVAQCGALEGAAWKSTIADPFDDFVVYGEPGADAQWVKFTMLACETPAPGAHRTVYYQNSRDIRFHYDFGSAWLRPLLGMTRAQYDAATLHANGQQALLGAVLFPTGRNWGTPEFGIQLVRHDAYTREEALSQLQAVAASLDLPDRQAFYMPAFEQQAAAEQDAAFFAANGFPVSSVSRWASGNRVYTKGWAIGTLKNVAANDIGAAYERGEIGPDDILITDGVPAELPFLAGIISLAPATPNSHVAILARTYGTPFAAIVDPADQQAALAKVGTRVILRTTEDFGRPRVDVVSGASITQTQWTELLELKAVTPLQYAPMQPTGAVALGVDLLTPADIARVGGKAANYGLLRRSIPESTRPGLAFTFDLWNAFMAQTLSNGRTLRQEIDDRLSGYAWPPEPASLAETLSGIRDLIRGSQTDFSPALRTAILSTLQSPVYELDPQTKIRFRSSTNVEDSASYTGAGLYDSYSGCLQDDLDADTVGPSACDPTEANERGVFRAIKRVYASFYNDNAFVQRLRLGVNEHEVGMGILVHHSFPDDTELANGVAVLERRGGLAGSVSIRVTLQPGANSVTNPELGQVPEEVDIDRLSFGTFTTVRAYSNLTQLGHMVMDSPADYTHLADLLDEASARFVQEGGPADHLLDFEFKKTTIAGGPGVEGLEIKQVRPLPHASTTPTLVPFMLSEPAAYRTYEGEGWDAVGRHRLKTRLDIAMKTQWLNDDVVNQGGLLHSIAGDLKTDNGASHIDGTFATLPEAQYTRTLTSTTFTGTHSWRVEDRIYSLTIPDVPLRRSVEQGPIVLASDFGSGTSGGHRVLGLGVRYSTPKPSFTWLGIETTLEDGVGLGLVRELEPLAFSPWIETAAGGESIETTYALRGAIVEFAAGYTAPVVGFGEATITGVTTRPIVVHNTDALTGTPHHHNFGLTVLVDPWLEPTLTSHQRRQLLARHARYLLFQDSGLNPQNLVVIDEQPYPFLCVSDVDDGSGSGIPDGAVTIDDLLHYVTVFLNGYIEADVDDGTGVGTMDNAVTIDDMLYFLAQFSAGC